MVFNLVSRMGIFLIPLAVAYFILFFDVCWFYRSFSLDYNSIYCFEENKKAEKENWLLLSKPLENFEKVTHVVVIPNFKENFEKLRKTIESLANQSFPTKRIYVVLGYGKTRS